jgi:hypothetical protein
MAASTFAEYQIAEQCEAHNGASFLTPWSARNGLREMLAEHQML